jgi:uncharacterized membrane protein YjjP (DUF1212 family)
MPEYAGEKPVLLIKKMGGLVLLLFGFVLAALGYANESNGIIILGVLLLIGGMVLLVLKIYRRNQL